MNEGVEGNGRYFIYNALDDSIGASYLYLWQPESGVLELIYSADSTDAFGSFAWLPDSSGVYFNLGREALCKRTLLAVIPIVLAILL